MNENSNSTKVRSFGFRAPRFPVRFGFSLQVNATHEHQEALCSNISEEGLAADLRQVLAPKTEVTLWLMFPGSTTPVQIQACVEYRQERRHGFSFIYSSGEEHAQVLSYIHSLTAKK